MIVDTTLQFAARRNVPIRYNRELVSTTIKAMERVSEIRARRERAFYKKRMAGNKERQRALDKKLVEENEHLLPRQRASERLAQEAGVDVETMEAQLMPTKTSIKRKMKQKLLVGGGVEETMDVDED